MKAYQVMKVGGFGVMESPNVVTPTEIIRLNKEDAFKEAKKKWLEETTEEDRKSGWCDLHYTVQEVEIK
jgi:hypothetical protein